MNNPPAKKIVRFLLLGNLQTDRRLKNFIEFFRDSGFDVELFFASSQKTIETETSFEDIKIHEIKLTLFRGRKMFLQYHNLLKRALDAAGPCEILFSTELFSLKAAAEAKKSGKAEQLFYDARELYTELPAVKSHPLKKLFWKRWEKNGLQQTDLVIVTAPEDSKAIREVHDFLPPSITIRNFPETEALHQNIYLRENFRIPSGKKIYVYAGGLQHDRGLEKMIRAMTKLKDDDSVFIMIGDGHIKESLQKQVERLYLTETIFFHPAVDSGKLIRILSSADIGISLIETHSQSYALALPSKVFEYMLAGLPVVSSPLKQVKDLLDGNEGIFFANPDNQEEIVAACQQASEKSNDQSFRSNLHDDAAKNFTFETEAKVLKQFLSPPTPNT